MEGGGTATDPDFDSTGLTGCGMVLGIAGSAGATDAEDSTSLVNTECLEFLAA